MERIRDINYWRNEPIGQQPQNIGNPVFNTKEGQLGKPSQYDMSKLKKKEKSAKVKETGRVVDPLTIPADEGEDYEPEPAFRWNKHELGAFGDIESKPTEKALNIINEVRADGLIKKKGFSLIDVYNANMEEGKKEDPLPIEWRPHIKKFDEMLEETIPSIDKQARKNALKNQIQNEEIKYDKHARPDGLQLSRAEPVTI